MAYDIRVNFRTWIPGAGFNLSGVAVQGKQVAVGQIDVTSYTTGGETVNAQDLGLETVDAIVFDVERVNNANTEPAASNLLTAQYIRTTSKVMIKLDENNEVSTTQDARLYFIAIGDSALAPELT